MMMEIRTKMHTKIIYPNSGKHKMLSKLATQITIMIMCKIIKWPTIMIITTMITIMTMVQ